MYIDIANPPERSRSGARALYAVVALALSSATAFAADMPAFVPSNFHDTVSVVDVSTSAVTTTFANLVGDPSEGNPGFWGVALSSRDGMLYLSADYDNQVYQIDTSTGATVHRFNVGTNPRGIAVDPSGKRVYVANFNSSSMSIIDVQAQTVSYVDFSISGLAFPNPIGLALNLAGTRAYVTDTSVSHRLCRINLATLPAQVGGADCVVVGDNDSANPTGVALSPDGTRAYVSIHGSGSSIAVVDTASMSVLNTFPLGFSGPNGFVVSASGKRGYVGTTTGKIISLDLTRADNPAENPIIHVIEGADIGAILGVSISPDGTRLLAVDNSSSHLHVVDIVGDADTVVDSVPVNQGPNAVGQFTPRDALFVSGFDKSG